MVSLGYEVDLGSREFRPDKERLVRLLQGTRALLRRSEVKPRWVSVVAGHWAWLFTLYPAFFSIFQEVYLFLERSKTPWHPKGMYGGWEEKKVWSGSVRSELRRAAQLAPLLLANVAAPCDLEVICTDACGEGGAASVHATKSLEEVSRLVRESYPWEGALESPPPSFFLGPE